MAITMGDASGVGPEIVLRRAADGALGDDVVVYGDLAILRRGAALLVARRADGGRRPRRRPRSRRARRGRPRGGSAPTTSAPVCSTRASGAAARDYVIAATDDALAGRVAGLVTMPMNKEATQRSDPGFVGHTELIAARCGAERVTMMLTNGPLAVTHVSTHCSLADAIERVRTPRVLDVIRLTDATLRRFLDRPRVAVCGLNPHAGEHGLFGREDIEHIVPAIEAARAEEIDASGPHPADTVFFQALHRQRYDAIVCMYHDQGHGPMKLHRVRLRRERDARPADHPHVGRSRHRVRHRMAGRRVHRLARPRAALRVAARRPRRTCPPVSVPFHRIRIHVDAPRVDDVAAATDATLASAAVTLEPGSEVAIACGSRGIADLPTVVARVAAWVRACGATPFIVPAMGSHGGATAQGQRAVLEAYGLGDPAIGAAIRSSMDVVELPQGASPVRVFTDATAASAGATIVVNRVKPHTDFSGPYESGLMKMIAIGLGKRVQAEALHAYGVRGLRDLMPLAATEVLRSSNVVLGVGIVENALDATLAVEAIPAARIPNEEPRLLALAREHAPALPVDRLDVLLVDRMGKDVSGVGMDTNVIGRLLIAGQAEPQRPSIAMIACSELTPASHGNACGMGLADVVTEAFAAAVDHDVTRTNVVTSGFLLRGKLPMVAADDREAWEWCLRGAGVVDAAAVRAARIVDTLHTSELWVTDAVLDELQRDEARARRLDVLDRDLVLHATDGRLRPFG